MYQVTSVYRTGTVLGTGQEWLKWTTDLVTPNCLHKH